MEHAMTITFLIVALISGGLLISFLDAKYQWRLADWLNGRCSNPFEPSPQSRLEMQLREKDAKIDQLSERIATLEAIVTEPAYDLKRQIDSLK